MPANDNLRTYVKVYIICCHDPLSVMLCVCVQCCVGNFVNHVPTAGDRERGERFGLSSSYHRTTQAVSSTVLT